MKKLVFIIMALFFTLNLFSEKMSVGIAQIVAQNWYSIIYETENTTISNYSIETSNGIQTAFIFNFSEGGFVVTSASNDAEPILAYNDVGSISSDRSPSLEWLISCYSDQVYEIIEDNLYYQLHRNTWLQLFESTYTEDRTEVLLPMDPTWNQGAPYNNFAPFIDGNRCVAGCGPIAMAQIINYNKYLSDYYFSNEFIEPNYDFLHFNPLIVVEIDEDALTYDFPTFEALDPYLSDIRELYNSGNSIDYDDGFAALSFACGIGLKAMYASSTGTYGGSNIVRTYAKNFGYKSEYFSRASFQGNWEALLINEINNDRIIHYGGEDPDAGGHAFILQGYSIGPPAIPCFYVNWGWGDSGNDGWYTLNNLNPILTNYSFTENQRTTINIEPAPLTMVGQLFAASPEFAGSTLIGPIGFVDIELTYSTPSHPFGAIVEGEYCSVVNGSYYIQLNEQLPIGTEFQITITSTNYETKTFNGEVTTDSNVLFMEKMELFWKFKPLFDGWNWESFPVLDRTGNDPVSAIPVLEEMEDFPEEIVNITILNDGPIGYNQGYGELYYDAFQMLWFPQSGYELQSTRCHKIKVLPEIGLGSFRTLEIEGTTLDQTAPIDLITGQDNWIGYWVKARQDIDDAFGEENFDKIYSIKAQDWEWKDTRPIRGEGDPIPLYYPIRPLNYGKGYVVRVKEDILGFQWNVSGEIGSQYKRKTTESFTYEEKPDYESVIIDSISGGGYITEIGVFENEVCIGASVVDSLPLQILAYTDAVNRGGNLTFQVSYGYDRGYQSVRSYSVLNLDEGTFENKPLILGAQKHNIIQLYLEGDEEDTPISTNLTLYSNYPNPFNPSTTISFSLLEDSEVSLKVFNVKGQVVKTLLKKQIEAGEHIITWEGKDKNNKQVSSGIYFYKISTGKEIKVNKMLLLK